MSLLPPQLYDGWRSRVLTLPALHDGADFAGPAERLLQSVWLHQRLLRDHLRTLDGRPLRVLHPGFHNREPGPDFRSAVLQFDSGEPLTGDVEIDLQTSHWRAHGHHQNPAFQKVLLHVVWEEGQTNAANVPVLALKPWLDAPLAELALWLGTDAAKDWPMGLSGQCRILLAKMNEAELLELLRQAAHTRLQAKAAQFEARARQVGWEQSLWEGLFRALGYKQNVWPMQRLAELLPRWGAGKDISPLVWQGRLFGLAGLLPADAPSADSESSQYIRHLWDYWWRERNTWGDSLLPRSLWCFHGLRPANHPQRRLALSAHWLSTGNTLSRLETWLTASLADSELAPSLLEALQAPADDFWSWHWTFRCKRNAKPQPLLGATRVTDLAVNVVIPWLWIRAKAGKNNALQNLAEHRYFAWPKTEDNTVLRLARRRLLGGLSTRKFTTAAHQQGLMQIVRDFCDHSNAVCAECPFPELLKTMPVPRSGVLENGLKNSR